MKNHILLAVIVILLISSCQKKQMAYFQKSQPIEFEQKSNPKIQIAESQILSKPLKTPENPVNITEKTVISVSTEQPAAQPKKLKTSKLQHKILTRFLEKTTKTNNPKDGTNYNKLGRASGILGIAGIVVLFLPYIGFLGFLACLTGLVLGIISVKKADKKGMSIVGIVSGSLVILFTILAVIFIAANLVRFV